MGLKLSFYALKIVNVLCMTQNMSFYLVNVILIKQQVVSYVFVAFCEFPLNKARVLDTADFRHFCAQKVTFFALKLANFYDTKNILLSWN